EGGRLPLRGIACEVSGLRGELLARSSGAPEGGLALAEDGFGQRRLDGEVWRVFTVTQGDLRVASAERMAGRTGFMRQVALVLLAALSLGLLASLALVWWAVGRALGPLSSLRDQLAGRDAGDRRAVATPPGAVELEPMVATLNQVLGRERDALDRERRLTDDLAHELRTPLAAIRTQLQVAQRTEGPRADHARDAAEQAAERLGHSLDQLLALARERSAPADRASLDAVLDGVLEELAAPLRARNLSVRRDAVAGVPPAPAGLVRIVLRNVLENAVRHSPEGGIIGVTALEDGGVGVRIDDQGPGLDAEQRRRALDRGWRGHGGGRGLGLAIVTTIMARTDGRVALTAAPGGGLRVRVSWPSADSV
ncbi:sensor histidine kinase, partial [Alcanivorax sp. 521-1]